MHDLLQIMGYEVGLWRALTASLSETRCEITHRSLFSCWAR